jgi:hypothetical protein
MYLYRWFEKNTGFISMSQKSIGKKTRSRSTGIITLGWREDTVLNTLANAIDIYLIELVRCYPFKTLDIYLNLNAAVIEIYDQL